MLIATNDEHERRTLVEDTVGKILSACWRGVACEIMQVLREVVNRYVNDERVDKPKVPARQLSLIGLIFGRVIDHIPGDNPLQRIMDDAVDGVSKHQLLLGERVELAALSSEARHTLKRKRATRCLRSP
ncbi:hypothetical protein EDC04DRAFT_2738583 [Pisolithus marmoratus]|nr:hypothetical protein EDC04DRAFT_2738583 [Pisolithus marmoratus]